MPNEIILTNLIIFHLRRTQQGDEEAAKRIMAEVYDSCEKLKQFGIYI